MRKLRLSALLLALCLLCGCAGESTAVDDPPADYDGTWYFAKNGVACEFGEGTIYREDETSSAGKALTGIYNDAGDHLEANLADVGGVSEVRKLYIVDSDQGQVLCDSADGKGTVYFYRDPLAALTALEAAEAASGAEPTPAGDASPVPGEEASDAPTAVPPELSDDPDSSSSPSDPEPQPTAQTEQRSGMVWVSQSGSKYHSKSSCSGMKNPSQISLSEAQSRGYTPCKRCY